MARQRLPGRPVRPDATTRLRAQGLLQPHLDPTAEKEERAEPLVLHRRRGIAPRLEAHAMVVEHRDLGGAQLARMAPAMAADELSAPVDAGKCSRAAESPRSTARRRRHTVTGQPRCLAPACDPLAGREEMDSESTRSISPINQSYTLSISGIAATNTAATTCTHEQIGQPARAGYANRQINRAVQPTEMFRRRSLMPIS